MKNSYGVFGGLNYYPSGGYEDLIGIFETIERAKVEIEKNKEVYDWVQIVDFETHKIVLNGYPKGNFISSMKWTWDSN